MSEDAKAEDITALKKGEDLFKDDKLLEADKVLSEVDESLLGEYHKEILKKAKDAKTLVSDLKSKNTKDDEWIKQGRKGGTDPTLMHYKLDKSGPTTQIVAKVETPMHRSMLVPLLSVLNETELFEIWLPKWSSPKMGLRKFTKLAQVGRASQIFILTFDMPWPMAPREIVLRAVAFDDIDENGDIGIHLTNLESGDQEGDIEIPPPEDDSVVRIDFKGGFLFRRCPPDHEELESYKKNREKSGNEETEEESNDDDDDVLVVSFCFLVNPKLKLIPQSFLNFILRTAMGTVWQIFFKVARDVKHGKRKEHASAIEKKRLSLYDWVDARVKTMLSLPKAVFNQNTATL